MLVNGRAGYAPAVRWDCGVEDSQVVERLHKLVDSLETLADRCARQLSRRSEVDATLNSLQNELGSLLPEDSDGYRVFDRLRRETTIWRRAGFEYAQPDDCKLVLFWLDVLRRVLETYEPTFLSPSPKDQILLQGGDIYSAKAKVFALFKRATSRLDIVDSYMDEELLPYIKSLPETLVVRLLTHDKKPIFRTLFEALHAERTTVQARQSAAFHDRFVVLDGREVWHLGASLNGIGGKTSMLIRVTDSEERAKLITEFDDQWESAAPLEPT